MVYNPLLQRQIRKYLGGSEGIPDRLRGLFGAINESYDYYEADRKLIERSMDLSSLELIEVNRRLVQQAARQKLVLGKLRELLRTLQLDEGEDRVSPSDGEFDEDDLVAAADILMRQLQRRRDAERRLQESEERFRLLAEHSTDIIGRYSPEGICLYVSPSCRPLLGYDPDELIGRHFSLGLHADDHEPMLQFRDLAQGLATIITFTYRYRTKWGEYIWLETTAHAIRDPQSGEMLEAHTASRDITARKKAEDELKRLSVVASKTDNSVVLTDRSGRIEWVNEAFSRLSGYSLEEVVGRRGSEIVHGELTDPDMAREIEEAVRTARPTILEIANYHKDGHVYWVSATITPIFDKAGEVERFVAIENDITARRQESLGLQYHAARLTALLENMQAGVLVEDEVGNIVVINQLFCDMFQLEGTPQNLLGTSSTGLAVTAKDIFVDGEAFVVRVAELMRNHELCMGEELSLVDGRVFERDYIPIFVDEAYAGHLWFCRDITERKQQQEAIGMLNAELRQTNKLLRVEHDKEKEYVAVLEKLNQMKSEFVSGVSHELRTPLASIIGFTQTILIDPDLPSQMQREFLQIVYDEGKRLAKLINDMLDLSRIENGGAIVERSPTNVVPLVERGMQSVLMQAEARRIRVESVFGRDSIVANIDPDRTLQVVINLLSNAVKFTPDGGHVRIRADVEGDQVLIEVADNGMGIPADDLPNLFQKFFRVHRPGTAIRGTGLGLAITKHLVELQAGTIAVHSKEHEGSTFTVRFPQQ